MLNSVISPKKKIYLPILYSDATSYFLIRSNKREILKILILQRNMASDKVHK